MGGAYLPQGSKGGAELLTDDQSGRDPVRQLATHAAPSVAVVEENDGGKVVGMADGTADGLVDGLHAEVLVVSLAGETAVSVPRLRGGAGGAVSEVLGKVGKVGERGGRLARERR